MNKINLSVIAAVFAAILFLSSCGKSTTGSNAKAFNFTAGGTSYSYTNGTGMIGHTSSNELQFVMSDNNNNTMSFAGGTNASGNYPFSIATSLTWTVNSKTYTTSGAPSGNPSGNIVANITGATATATVNTILYNITNPSDSVILTNATYSGSYLSTY